MAKPDLLLLHGALGAQSQFDPWVEELSRHFTLHRPEFEGHGAQEFRDRPFRIEYFAENLEEYVTEKGLEAPMVFGYSMGGYVALYLSHEKPGVFSRIFTLATKFDWTPESAKKESAMLDPAGIKAKVPHFAEALAKRHYGNDWEEHLRRTAEMMQHLGASPALTESKLAQIETPCRITVGDKDRMVSEAETRWAQENLPHASFELLPDTPHPIEKVPLEGILPILLDFLGTENQKS